MRVFGVTCACVHIVRRVGYVHTILYRFYIIYCTAATPYSYGCTAPIKYSNISAAALAYNGTLCANRLEVLYNILYRGVLSLLTVKQLCYIIYTREVRL